MRALIVGNGVVGQATRVALKSHGVVCWMHDVVPARSEVPIGHCRFVDAVFLCVHAGGHVSKDSALCMELAHEVAFTGLLPTAVVVQRTTCVPGTADKAAARSGLGSRYLVWPEFLRQRHWQEDTMNPSRVVVGGRILATVFHSFIVQYSEGKKLFCLSRREAELCKLLSNAFLALRVSAWNCVSGLVESRSALQEAILAEPRLDSFDVFFGKPFGGKCLPKDLDALLDYCHQEGIEADVFDAVRKVNQKLEGRRNS